MPSGAATRYPGVVQLIERAVWDREAVSLSLTTRTRQKTTGFDLSFFVWRHASRAVISVRAEARLPSPPLGHGGGAPPFPRGGALHKAQKLFPTRAADARRERTKYSGRRFSAHIYREKRLLFQNGFVTITLLSCVQEGAESAEL